ncbi:hypothetical protein ACQP2Y_45505 [Actinoplanes sp. CA-051413]|uniref:hypothetical protein n=1 Tax=Actinoplanes sp. CA-051413 TaxID=3239899 RepID=UPI003D98F516
MRRVSRITGQPGGIGTASPPVRTKPPLTVASKLSTTPRSLDVTGDGREAGVLPVVLRFVATTPPTANTATATAAAAPATASRRRRARPRRSTSGTGSGLRGPTPATASSSSTRIRSVIVVPVCSTVSGPQ